MDRTAYAIASLSALLALTNDAHADESLTATLQCDRAVEPGRLRCTVEARAASGRTLQWADVVVIELPELAQALKGRLAQGDSISRDATTERWAFGLVAKRAGEGTAKVRVRAVVCEGDAGAHCTTVTAEAVTILHVG